MPGPMLLQFPPPDDYSACVLFLCKLPFDEAFALSWMSVSSPRNDICVTKWLPPEKEFVFMCARCTLRFFYRLLRGCCCSRMNEVGCSFASNRTWNIGLHFMVQFWIKVKFPNGSIDRLTEPFHVMFVDGWYSDQMESSRMQWKRIAGRWNWLPLTALNAIACFKINDLL